MMKNAMFVFPAECDGYQLETVITDCLLFKILKMERTKWGVSNAKQKRDVNSGTT